MPLLPVRGRRILVRKPHWMRKPRKSNPSAMCTTLVLAFEKASPMVANTPLICSRRASTWSRVPSQSTAKSSAYLTIRQFGRPLARRRSRRERVDMAPPGCHGRCRCSSSTDRAMLASSGERTPPTQLAMSGSAVLRVGLGAAVGRAVTDRDAMPDGDLVGADKDVLDEQPQDALTFGNGGGGGLGAQVGEEVLEAVGELKVDLAVGQLGVEGLNLLAQAVLAGAQRGHAGAQLIEGDQLLLVGADQPVDRLAGLGQAGVQAGALRGGGVGGAGQLESLGDLGADQG